MMDEEETTIQIQNKEENKESNITKRKMPAEIPIADMPIIDAEEAMGGQTCARKLHKQSTGMHRTGTWKND